VHHWNAVLVDRVRACFSSATVRVFPPGGASMQSTAAGARSAAHDCSHLLAPRPVVAVGRGLPDTVPYSQHRRANAATSTCWFLPGPTARHDRPLTTGARQVPTAGRSSPTPPNEAVLKYRWQGTVTNPFAVEDRSG
jgi:hypothetical protein